MGIFFNKHKKVKHDYIDYQTTDEEKFLMGILLDEYRRVLNIAMYELNKPFNYLENHNKDFDYETEYLHILTVSRKIINKLKDNKNG